MGTITMTGFSVDADGNTVTKSLNNTSNATISANLNVFGNLNVTGNINQINSDQINVLDKNIVLASNNNNDSYINGAGLILQSSNPKELLYKKNETDEYWETNIKMKVHSLEVVGTTTLTTPMTNDMLANDSISFGSVSVALGATDATPAFNLSNATNYPTSSLTGTITNSQLAGSISNDKLDGSITNDKLVNDSISFGSVSVALGADDPTPAFDLSDAINYPTSRLTGTITNSQLASASQFLLKDNSVGSFPTDSFLTTNASDLIVPKTEASVITTVQGKIEAGINITRSIGLNSILTLALSNALINMASINGYGFNTSTTTTVNQFLLKDTSVGSFSNGDLLNINSSGKVDNITPTQLLNNLTVSNGLIKSTNAISISTSPTINIINAGMTLKNLSGTNGGNALLKIQAGTSASFSPQIELIQDGEIRTYLKYDKSNNKFYILAPTGVIELLAYGGAGQINIKNQNVEIKIDNSIKLKVQSTQVDINTTMSMSGKIAMNSRTINFGGATDSNHQILYSNGNGTMDGVLVRGYGGNVPFFRLQSTNPSVVNVLDASYNQVNIKTMMSMNAQPINLYAPTDTHHQILFSNSGGTMNGVLIRGYGNDVPFFRLQGTSAGAVNILDAYIDEVRVYNKLSVIKSNATLQNDTNDIFTVRNTGFTKAIIHSTNADCELAFKTGSIQATLSYTTLGQFKVETQGTINLKNNSGRLAFQSDRNLVIYNSGGGSVWSSNTSTSERRFKDNIVSLDLETSYNTIKQLNPVSFVYKEDPNKHKKGFIVDEIEDKIPECLKEITNCDCEDMKSTLLFKEDIVPDLVASVKFLINKVETLEQQLLTQSTLINNIQTQINSN